MSSFTVTEWIAILGFFFTTMTTAIVAIIQAVRSNALTTEVSKKQDVVAEKLEKTTILNTEVVAEAVAKAEELAGKVQEVHVLVNDQRTKMEATIDALRKDAMADKTMQAELLAQIKTLLDQAKPPRPSP